MQLSGLCNLIHFKGSDAKKKKKKKAVGNILSILAYKG